MGKKILVAQLGNRIISEESKYAYFSSLGLIDEGRYIKESSDMKNCYPFLAYLQAAEAKHEQFTDLVLIGTEGSAWDDLLKKAINEISSAGESSDTGKEMVCEDGIGNNGSDKLKEKLNKKYSILSKKYSINKIYILIIKNGVSEAEINENFNNIKKQMEEIISSKENDKRGQGESGTENEISIYLDITNAFRSVPMLVFATTNYLSVMHKELNFKLEVHCSVLESKLSTVDDINYKDKKLLKELDNLQIGNMGVSDELIDSKEVIPMVDITIVSLVNQWSMAINEFYDNGSVVKLIQLIKDVKDEWFEDSITVQGEENGCYKKKELIRALEQFSFAVNSNSLKDFGDAAYIIINIHTSDKMPSYISDFVNFLTDDFKKRFGIVAKIKDEGQNAYGSLTLAIARWYAGQGRLGDAAIALQEGLVTYVIENYFGKVTELLKKRIGISDEDADTCSVGELRCNDECRDLVSDLVFSRYDEYDDFEEYCKENHIGESESDEWKEFYENNKDKMKSSIKMEPDIWKEFMKKYDDICRNLINPAMKIQYSDSSNDMGCCDTDENSAVGKTNMDKAADNIDFCINMMIGNYSFIRENYLKYKLKYLCAIVMNDFFISYRRKYNVENDGYTRACIIKEKLEKKQKNKKEKYTVWMDEKLKSETREFTPLIRKEIRNSRYFIILLGNNVFDRELYQEGTSGKLDVFYEEILTAYRHFNRIADDRIIVVTFDEFDKIPESKQKFKNQDKNSWRCDILSKLAELRMQKQEMGPIEEDVNYNDLIKNILNIKPLKIERVEAGVFEPEKGIDNA